MLTVAHFSQSNMSAALSSLTNVNLILTIVVVFRPPICYGRIDGSIPATMERSALGLERMQGTYRGIACHARTSRHRPPRSCFLSAGPSLASMVILARYD